MREPGKQLAAVVTVGVLVFGLVGLPIVYASDRGREGHVSFDDDHKGGTESPTKHLIVIIGENRTFDHIVGTYQPKRSQKIWNLLSYQMWQQSDCDIHNVTHRNPTGCLSDLYPFVTTTFAGPAADEGGSSALAFYNVQHGMPRS